MHLADTRIEHEAGCWKIDFIGDDGDAVSVKVADEHAVSADERAKAVMVQLTAYGTRGGGRSLNSYDAVSNGNFDDDEPFLDTRH
ncbi:hypothetical protein GFM09_21645 [Rhizobium leguminosarum bv. viciae]|uniref:hypothetical protein n=1 Tax=Rhizobium leguminosarum TaxID=384 RepID=UPI001441E024|nr:hypothetical protein [Rhizobium leguminosarum]NKL63904.1 hypothetical protein [Rhizobium leguminosarum bv. viciae]NKL71846.1 hypothetical protein [Rhizobium leguminosarum bv. viciae]NKL88313.1 hypothetical protein [Rhizobium leguminosarum bv. viciae]